MKKNLFLLSLLIFALAGCNPNFTPNDSSVEPTSSSETTSETTSETSTTESSDDSSSGSEETTSEEDPPHQHTYSNEWSKDANNHWHECTVCGDKKDLEQHNFVQTGETENHIIYTCSTCSYSYEEAKPAPTYDPLDLMNDVIKGKDFIDPFAIRDLILSQEDDRYDFNDVTPDGARYGYSITHNEIIEHKNGVVTRPSTYSSDEFVSYNVVEVNSFGGLYNAINEINAGEKDYSTIKLSVDITQEATNGLVQYKAGKCLEIDLNNKHIYAPTEVNKPYSSTKWFTLQFLDKTSKAQVYVHGGTIEANRKMENDSVQDDSCCLSLAAGKSFRLEKLNLVARNATECIGDLSQYVTGHADNFKKVYMKEVNMEASLKALSIVGGTWDIDNCNVQGMAIVEGGTVSVKNTVVDASNTIYNDMNAYERGYSNSDLALVPVVKLNGNTVNTTIDVVMKNYYGAFTFNDAITVISRRRPDYSVPNVSVTGCTLSPVKIDSNVEEYRVTGYGLRVWDLANNPHEFIPVAAENNTFPLEAIGHGFGGMYLNG